MEHIHTKNKVFEVTYKKFKCQVDLFTIVNLYYPHAFKRIFIDNKISSFYPTLREQACHIRAIILLELVNKYKNSEHNLIDITFEEKLFLALMEISTRLTSIQTNNGIIVRDNGLDNFRGEEELMILFESQNLKKPNHKYTNILHERLIHLLRVELIEYSLKKLFSNLKPVNLQLGNYLESQKSEFVITKNGHNFSYSVVPFFATLEGILDIIKANGHSILFYIRTYRMFKRCGGEKYLYLQNVILLSLKFNSNGKLQIVNCDAEKPGFVFDIFRIFLQPLPQSVSDLDLGNSNEYDFTQHDNLIKFLLGEDLEDILKASEVVHPTFPGSEDVRKMASYEIGDFTHGTGIIQDSDYNDIFKLKFSKFCNLARSMGIPFTDKDNKFDLENPFKVEHTFISNISELVKNSKENGLGILTEKNLNLQFGLNATYYSFQNVELEYLVLNSFRLVLSRLNIYK